MKHTLAKTWCSALRPNGMPCGEKMRKSEAFGDQLGYYWCSAHEIRGRLLNYGVEHNYPAIFFGMYAIGAGNDPDLWKVAVLLGSDEMINEAVASLGLNESDVA